MLVDTHAHIQVHQFERDRAAVIEAAFAVGVTHIVVPGIELESSQTAVALAQRYPGRLFAGVGTHPHDAKTLTTERLDAQRALARQPGVVAIGEIGLDYYRDLSPRAVQREALVAQLDLARELDLPVILHNRDSHQDLVGLIRSHGQGLRGVFHCFIGDRAMARDVLDVGFYLSFAGPLAFPKNTELGEVAAWAPLDRIVIETDSPYLAPPPYRGKRNEPAYVAFIALRLAEVRGLALEEVAQITARNAVDLFRLPLSAPTVSPPKEP